MQYFFGLYPHGNTGMVRDDTNCFQVTGALIGMFTQGERAGERRTGSRGKPRDGFYDVASGPLS